jgi:hypothetical protein
MTVAELQAALKDMHPEAPVYSEMGWEVEDVVIDQNGDVILVEAL